MDKVRAVKDFVASALAFGAGIGLIAFNDEQEGVILGAISAIGSLIVTFFGGGNTK